MAVSSGQLIKASDINSINDGVSLSGTMPDAANSIQYYIGNNGHVFSHRPYGATLFQASFSNGMFGGGRLVVERWANGIAVETICDEQMGWFTDRTITVNSRGPSEYRIYSADNWQFAPIPWKIWCGQSDCQVGKKIVCWDGFKSSLNKVNSGSLITATLANAQRLGNE